MPPPKNLAELQSFMGMINYLNRFSPIIAQTSEPVRQLMKKETPFMWQAEHQKAFESLKQVITEAPVLAYYDPEKDNLIQSDASLQGIGCVLIQDSRPVCYASRSLTETESCLQQHRERATCRLLVIREVQPLCLWQKCHH